MKKFLNFLAVSALLLSGATSCDDDEKVSEKATLSLSAVSVEATAEGGVFAISVTSNSYWDVSVLDSEGVIATWVTSSATSGMGDGDISLTVDPNSGTSARTCLITISTASGEASQTISVSQTAAEVVIPQGYSFPICEMFKIDENYLLDNGVISGNTCTMKDGMVIRCTDPTVSMSFLCPAHTSPAVNGYFQRALKVSTLTAGNGWAITIPVKEELSGDLRFCFGSRKDGITTAGRWTFEWSRDSTSWKAFEGSLEASSSDAMSKYIDFSIAQSEKILAGGKIYFRFISSADATSTPYFAHGICITNASAPLSSIEKTNSTDVVYSNGFDDLISVNAQYIEVPMGFMRSWTTDKGTSIVLKDDYSKVTNCFGRPGYLQVSYADESLFSRNKVGSFTIKVGDRLKEMGYTKADLVLTFKAATMVNAYGEASLQNLTVSADSESGATVTDGAVGGSLEDGVFKSFTVKISGATQGTALTFGTAEKEGVEDYQKDYRFFLDDILVKTNGNTEKKGNSGNGSVGDYGEGNTWK